MSATARASIDSPDALRHLRDVARRLGVEPAAGPANYFERKRLKAEAELVGGTAYVPSPELIAGLGGEPDLLKDQRPLLITQCLGTGAAGDSDQTGIEADTDSTEGGPRTSRGWLLCSYWGWGSVVASALEHVTPATLALALRSLDPPATVNGSLVCLSSAFSYFVEREWLTVNPCHGGRQVERPGRTYEWIQSREEITRLLVECPKGIRELCAVAVGTGLRLDELLHLEWTDVYLARRLIAVHRGRQGTVKSGKLRHVPILDAIMPLLRELALQRGDSRLVFRGEGGRARSKPGVRVPFKQAAKRAGFSSALRFHDLRHTFASHWVLDGGDIFRLSRILGHANVTITQKVYAHLAPEAWEQDYHRVAFNLPATGTVYGLTRRKNTSNDGDVGAVVVAA